MAVCRFGGRFWRVGVMLLLFAGCAEKKPSLPPAPVHSGVGSCSDAHQVFVQTGEMIEPRSWHSATLLSNGRVLISGGTSDWGYGYRSGHYKNSTEIYDPKTNSFQRGPDMASARTVPVSALLDNGKILVAGGYTPELYSDETAEIFDPTRNAFSSLDAMPTAKGGFLRRLAFAVPFDHDRVLIGDGDSLQIYDSGTGSFSRADSSPTASHQEHLAIKLDDGRVLLACGGTEDRGAEIYDSKSRTFSATGKMLDSWSACGAALLPDGRVFILGGVITGKTKRAQLYDPKTGAFSWTSEFEGAPTFGFDLVGFGDGRVLLISTTEPVYEDSLTVQIYDSKHDRYTTVGTIRPLRHGYALTRLEDGRILISGGSNTSTTIKRSLLFCP